MIGEEISNRTELQWKEVLKHAKDALVYMDNAAAELLHWHGGLQRFLDAGASNVEIFFPFGTKSDKSIQKALIVLMSPLMDQIWSSLINNLRLNNFKYCVVVTSLPEKFHNEKGDETDQGFNIFEYQLCKKMMGRKNSAANIYHIPLFATHISQNVFIMPSFNKKLSIFNCGLIEMKRKRSEEMSFKDLTPDMELTLKHLAYSLHCLLDTFQVKGEFFSFGPLSYLLASELENISQQQKRKPSQLRKASLVVVDRLLDLAGPLSQSYETMFDKVMISNPSLPGHILDVAIDMEDLSAFKYESVFLRPLVAPGCIAHKNSSYEEACLNAILFKKPREALIEVNRNIVDCAQKEGINVEVTSRLTPDVLRKKVIALKDKQNFFMKYNGLLQQALAVVQGLEYSVKNNVDNLAAIEKALLQYLTTSSEDALSNIMQMINEREDMKYNMEEIVIFLAFFYFLTGETELANESAMQATLMETFLQDEEIKQLLYLFMDYNKEKNVEIVLDSVKTLFNIFKRLGTMRRRLKRYGTLFKSTNPAFPASYNPLLKQLLEDIFDPTLTDNPDIEFHSAGLRDYIKTGFSLFMNVAKPQPRDNPIIFIIVLGGVTASEIKIVHDIASRHKDKEILLGCTDVLLPSNVLRDIGGIVKHLSYPAKEDV